MIFLKTKTKIATLQNIDINTNATNLPKLNDMMD